MALDVNGTQLYVGSTTSADENSAIYFRTDDTNRMVVSSSGEIGIGTDTPSSFFEVYKSNTEAYAHDDGIGSFGGSEIVITNGNTTNNTSNLIFYFGGSGSSLARIAGLRTGTGASDLVFITQNK